MAARRTREHEGVLKFRKLCVLVGGSFSVAYAVLSVLNAGGRSAWGGDARRSVTGTPGTVLQEVLSAGGPAPRLEVELVLGEELVNRLVVLDVEERLVHCE